MDPSWVKGQGKHDPPNLSEAMIFCAPWKNPEPPLTGETDGNPKSGLAELNI